MQKRRIKKGCGRIFLVVFLSLFFIGLISATATLNQQYNLTISCYGYVCEDINVTVLWPNSSLMVDNQPTTDKGYYSVYQLTPTVNGEYNYYYSDGLNSSGSSFEVTRTGEGFNTGILLTDIFLIVLILFSLIWGYVRHSKVDFEKIDNKIISTHKNPGTTILKGVGYGLMKNAFLWYYLTGWILLIVINDLISRFASSQIFTYFPLVLDLYSFGFILVIVAWIAIVWRFVQHLLDITDDIGRGVN